MEQQPGHNLLPGRIMYMPEGMAMYTEETTPGIFNKEIVVSGILAQETSQGISNKLIVNINPGSKAHNNIIVTITAVPGRTAIITTGQAVLETMVLVEVVVEGKKIHKSL